METDPAAIAELEEVAVGGRAPGARPPGRPGGRRGPSAAARAALVVGGLAVAIVAVGLLGPRPAPGPEDAPVPSASPAAPVPPRQEAVAPASPGPIPLVRRSGPPLEDEHVLVAGRWMHLATGRPVTGAPDACARQRVLVLGSGRIVCVTADVTRSPGSRLALFDLAAQTVGTVRADPGAPPPAGAPAGGAESQALATLLGRRDIVIGDPVAIAVAAGPGPDELVLAWAAAGAGGYEIGLEAFRLAESGAQAERLGEWTVGRAPSTGRDAVETLANLAVTVDGTSRHALVGWTESGPGIAGPVRRLVIVRLDGGVPPRALPAAATRNLSPEAADGALRTGTPCGGGFGEGFGADGTVYVVCPGETAELRIVDARDDRPDGQAGAVLADAPLVPGGSTTGTAWLAGNGVAADDAGSAGYRWSPAVGTLWRVDFGAVDAGGTPRVASLALLPRRGSLETGVGGDAGPDMGPRPILALDAARGRLYALDAPVPRTGGRAVVHVIDVAGWRYLWSYPLADTATRAIALSPDGRLLYASTEPRDVGSPPSAVGVAVLDALTGVELAYAGRLRVGAVGPLQAVVVR